MRNKVLYIGRFMFPDLDAAANRVLGIGTIMTELGFEVVYAGSNEVCREVDLCEDGLYRYRGFLYTARTPYSSKDFYFKWDYFLGTAELLGVDNIKYIIAYHFPAVALLGLRKWCKGKGISLIADCTEWYKLSSNTLMWYVDSELRMRVVQPLVGNIIVISSYLENIYNRKKCQTVKIPIVGTEPAVSKTAYTGEGTVFCYCGNPGKKDLLLDIFMAFTNLYERRQDFKFEVVGLTKKRFIEKYALDIRLLDAIDKFATFHGFVSQTEAKKIVASSDFSVLLRNNQRTAMAGFPTKFVESMFCGTPMVANITGDLGQYLKDGANGFVVTEGSVEALLSALEKACNSSLGQRIQMMRGCIDCANTELYYKYYLDLMEEFLSRVDAYPRSTVL